MSDFTRDVLEPSQRAAELIAEVGGLPEISGAANNLRLAIDQTRQEIATAEIASRFPRKPSDHFLSMVALGRLSSEAFQAIEREGEAGLKRLELEMDLRGVEAGLMGLINRFVEIRADLMFAQQD